MKLMSKYKNPLPEFIAHGVKEIGLFTYVLKLDMTGIAIIQRITSTQSDISFTKLTTGDINTFWADPSVHVYTYLHKI